jgi:hypothetical protein
MGSVIMMLLCVYAAPSVLAQPAGWPTLTLPLFNQHTGNEDPGVWDGVYRWKAKDNCRKWATGKREKALVEEELWMVLQYVEEGGDNGGPEVPYCYLAAFFSHETSLEKLDPETVVGWGYLCPDWPPVFFSPEAPKETYLIDGMMCKNVEEIPDVGCDQLWIKLQARLDFPYKNPPTDRNGNPSTNVRQYLLATKLDGWAIGLCGPYYNFFDATMDATPDNAFLKCRIKWKATWQKELPGTVVDDFFSLLAESEDFRPPCDFEHLGFKAFPIPPFPSD